MYHLQRHLLFTSSLVKPFHIYAPSILKSSKALRSLWCLMLWEGCSCRWTLLQKGAPPLCNTLTHLCYYSSTRSVVPQSVILALFPSFFSGLLQHLTGSTKLSWGRTQQHQPNTMFSLFKWGISDFRYSSLGHADYSMWGLYSVWNTTSPHAKYLKKVEVGHATYCIPSIKFLVGVLCPELKGGQWYFSHPILYVSIWTDRKTHNSEQKVNLVHDPFRISSQ